MRMDGKGSLWLIGGESGVGKSRLIEELRTRALIEGVLTLRGQTVSAGGLPYQLWRDPLRRLILSAADQPGGSQRLIDDSAGHPRPV